MKAVWKVGQWLAIAAVLLSLAGLALSGRSNPQEDAQVADLVVLARMDLADRLSAHSEAIVLESTGPLTFPCPSPNDCQGRQPGYVIRLRVDDLIYEYNGKVLGQRRILWHEVADAPGR